MPASSVVLPVRGDRGTTAPLEGCITFSHDAADDDGEADESGEAEEDDGRAGPAPGAELVDADCSAQPAACASSGACELDVAVEWQPVAP